MCSSLNNSCWTDPRMQKSHEREFVQFFSTHKGHGYAVSRNNYSDLVKRVGNILGPNDKIRDSFTVMECSVNGEWVMRLVDKEHNRILLPLEDVFVEIESLHIKGNHKPKTPLLNELKQIYFYPNRTMVEFVLDRCPVCLERKKTKVPDEPVHPKPTVSSEFSRADAQHKRLKDPVTKNDKKTADKLQVPASFEQNIQRNCTNNIAHPFTSVPSAVPSLMPPHCLSSPIPFPGKPLSAIAHNQLKSKSSFLTSTPVDRNIRPKSHLGRSESLLNSTQNESRISVDSGFIHFLNNSNISQSDHQYLRIIREESSENRRDDQQPLKKMASDGNPLQPIEKSIDAEKVLSLAAAIKTEVENLEYDFQENSFADNETRNKIWLDLDRERFGNWRMMKSRSNPNHQYYYNSQTGMSQNERPTIWELELNQRLKKELDKRCFSSDIVQTVERGPSISNDFESRKVEDANKDSEFGNKISKSGGTLATEVAVARPFNDTNDALELLFTKPSEKSTTQEKPTEEEAMMELRKFCDVFQQQLAEEMFDILEEGTVTLISKDSNQADASAQVQNFNLENIPIDENAAGETNAPIEDCCVDERQPQINKTIEMRADSNPTESAVGCTANFAATAFVSTSNAKREARPVTTICSNSNKIQLLDQQKLMKIIPKRSEISNNFIKSNQFQMARKRSLRQKEPISKRLVKLRSSSESSSEESSEEHINRPPPLLVHKMPRCKVLMKRITKTSVQKFLFNRPKNSYEEHLSSTNDASSCAPPNTSRRLTQNSHSSSSSFKQELFQCVKCTRTRTFAGEIAYHLHELSRHRNCVSTNEFVIDYIEKLSHSSLNELTFCCLLCDQTYACDDYWGHMRDKHNAKIGAKHRRISRTIRDIKEGKVRQQKLNIKKEFLSDSDEDDFSARDRTWNGRDDDWIKLEVGAKKNRRRTGQRSGEKRVKTEVLE